MTEYTPDDVTVTFAGKIITGFADGKIRLSFPNTSYLYDVHVKNWYGYRYNIEVEANNRAQAKRYAENAGYEVFSINLVG